jgi:hypothetical protein
VFGLPLAGNTAPRSGYNSSSSLSFKMNEKRKRMKRKKETSQQTNEDEEGVEKRVVSPTA